MARYPNCRGVRLPDRRLRRIPLDQADLGRRHGVPDVTTYVGPGALNVSSAAIHTNALFQMDGGTQVSYFGSWAGRGRVGWPSLVRMSGERGAIEWMPGGFPSPSSGDPSARGTRLLRNLFQRARRLPFRLCAFSETARVGRGSRSSGSHPGCLWSTVDISTRCTRWARQLRRSSRRQSALSTITCALWRWFWTRASPLAATSPSVWMTLACTERPAN